MDENYVFCFFMFGSYAFACITLYLLYLMERGDN